MKAIKINIRTFFMFATLLFVTICALSIAIEAVKNGSPL